MAVAKAEWGYKRICQGCGCKFYDLQRNPIICPSCDAKYDPEALLKSRRPRSAPAKTVKVEAKPVVAAVDSKAKDEDSDGEADGDDLEAAVKDVVLPDDEVLAAADADDDDLDSDDDEIADVVVVKDDEET